MSKLVPLKGWRWIDVSVVACLGLAALGLTAFLDWNDREGAIRTLAGLMVLFLAVVIVATRSYFRRERAVGSRAAAEAALKSSEARYRDTFENAAVGIAHAALDGHLIRCNRHLCDMLGYSEQELKRKAISDITHPDDLAHGQRQRQLLEAGEIESYQLEKRYLRKDGEPIWARLNVCAVRDPAGAVNHTVALVEDIHLRKLTRLAMQTLNTDLLGEAFLRQVTRSLTELLNVEMAFVSEAPLESALRFSARAVIVDGEFVPDFSYDLAGTPCETVAPDKLCLYARQVQAQFPADELLATMGVESYAAVALGRPTEGQAPLGVLGIMSRRPLRNADAVRTLLPLLALRVGAELAHEREARKFRDLLDGSPTAVFLLEADCTIRMISRVGERLFGWESEGLVGQKLDVLFPESYQEAYQAQFRRHIDAENSLPGTTAAEEFWGLRRDGGFFPAQIHLRTLLTAEGRMTAAFVQDITERKQAQAALMQHNEDLEDKVTSRTAELLRARDEAQQASRAKSAFLAAMSHEIRTPMNGVVGMIDVLEQTRLESEQVEIVQTVRQSAHALLTIIDDVLDFSKIEAGHLQVDREPVDVAATVEAACDTLAPLAGRHGTELTLFTDPLIPRTVVCDALRLRQVLLNLAGNAVKFSSVKGGGGRVSVRASVAASSVQPMLEFSVCDNGIGMDEQMLARLFTPFTQADTGTTRRYGGTGLGLSISQRLVDLMGGDIGVHSAPGRGTTFTVRLPLVALKDEAEVDTDAFDLAGLCCIVSGGQLSPADDLGAYLAHSGATLYRAVDTAGAKRWLAHCAPGTWICILTDADEALAPTLAELRGVGDSRADLDLRFLVMQRGNRRGPRMTSPDVVALDREVLHRRAFLSAVALAAGRTTTPPGESGQRAQAHLAPLSAQQTSAQGRPILIAEDNEINQKVLLTQLALLGFTARVAGTGREALSLWQCGDYALLLTDLHMPQIDGYELAAAIRGAEAGGRRNPRIPIIALTANAMKGEAKRCLDLGMDDYMTKPVQLASLRAMLCKWLPAAATHRPDAPVPTASRPAALPMVLDVSVLQALIGDDDPEVINEFLQDFRASANSTAAQMRTACRGQHAELVEFLAHRLKSSARSVGALALGDLCERLEAAGHAGQQDTLARLWQEFETELAAVDELLVAAQV